jgi:hypothetical protein
MSAPQEFARLSAVDAILRAKAGALEAQLRNLSPAMDARFFASLGSR